MQSPEVTIADTQLRLWLQQAERYGEIPLRSSSAAFFEQIRRGVLALDRARRVKQVDRD